MDLFWIETDLRPRLLIKISLSDLDREIIIDDCTYSILLFYIYFTTIYIGDYIQFYHPQWLILIWFYEFDRNKP